MLILCHSAFARVATRELLALSKMLDLCHSAFARVATEPISYTADRVASLPQRIRAGSDGGGI